ncbi:MAG: response regulator [Chitinophagales bacterium]|jgi:CheY-like chemotaxis protein|nr:response regulator [Chitinophagales bacterium]
MNSDALNLVLADDDEDDRDLFEDALAELPIAAKFTSLNGGESLMEYLYKPEVNTTPDLVFLDLNMPRKNGFECLEEIKANEKLKNIPIIIFSTSYDEEVVKKLFDSGAQYYMQKPSGYNQLKKNLAHALELTGKKGINKIPFENFVLLDK